MDTAIVVQFFMDVFYVDTVKFVMIVMLVAILVMIIAILVMVIAILVMIIAIFVMMNVIQIIKHNLYIVLHNQLEKYYYMYYLALLKLQ